MSEDNPWRQLAIPPDCDEIAAQVTREHPTKSVSHRLSIAMNMTRGSANPKVMREALQRQSVERKP